MQSRVKQTNPKPKFEKHRPFSGLSQTQKKVSVAPKKCVKCLYCYYALLRPDQTQKLDNLICYLNTEKTKKVNFEWFCEFGKERHQKAEA